MEQPILTLREVACRRGGVTVLEGVSCSLRAGEALVLRGPNGIGKTTLLRTVAGLQPAADGTVDVDTDEIAYAAHADGVKSTLSVRENLGFWAGVFGRREIDAALAAFDLGALADRAAGALSAGQRRRLSLARLVVTGRRLWLLDEPTVSLDAASVALFSDAVGRHLSDGGAAMIATHIDLGLTAAETLDLTPFKARGEAIQRDEAFL